MKKILAAILIIVLLSGCAEKQRNITIVNKHIYIPKKLLTPVNVIDTPTVYTEEEVSKYIIDLYSKYKINNNKIYQIKNIVDKYNFKVIENNK